MINRRWRATGILSAKKQVNKQASIAMSSEVEQRGGVRKPCLRNTAAWLPQSRGAMLLHFRYIDRSRGITNQR
jgi:hypothetical protein